MKITCLRLNGDTRRLFLSNIKSALKSQLIDELKLNRLINETGNFLDIIAIK